MNQVITSLLINNLELAVHLGWPEEERATKQIVFVDIEIFYPAPPKACASDNLEDTFCYDELIKKLKITLNKKHFYLVEHLAQDIYQEIKNSLNMEIHIRLTKKPNIAGLKGGICFNYGDKR